jgi:drug/metabolite transporter (DMT)-like permease
MTPRVLLAYAAMIVIWGTTWAAIRIGVETVPPFLFALVRAISVASILTGLGMALGLAFPRDRVTLLAAAVAGIFNTGLSWAVIFWAEQFVPSGLVALFGATTPVWTAFLAHFLVRGDRLSWLKLAALGVGLAGTAVLVGSPLPRAGPDTGLATVLLALMPVTWGVAAVLAARYLQHASPVPVIAIEVWAGGIVLVPFALVEAGRPAEWTGPAIVAMAYLVLLGSCVGLVLNLWLYRKLRPTTVSLAQVLIPVQAVLVGALALGEQITPPMLVGAVLVFAAVGLNARASPAADETDDTATYDKRVV